MSANSWAILPTVTAADLVRHFADWQDRARSQPVVITRHGKSTHALLAYEQFQILSDNSSSGTDALDQCKVALFDEVGSATFILSDTLHVLAANRAATAMTRHDASSLEGAAFTTVFPEDGNELLHRYVHRTAAAREHLLADAPLGDRGRWVHFRTYPCGAGAAVTLRDTTDEITARRIADIKGAMVAALEHDGGIGYVRISVREVVEQVNSALTELLGISEEAFRRVRFSTVISCSGRTAFSDALERAFAGGGPQRIDASLVDRDGKQLPVRISIVELRGDYASEGAIVLVTRPPV
ncbi:MAG: sensor protein [Bradyrhizobium sp.]|nr:sensor protein [Bradyrhizobium sp.]